MIRDTNIQKEIQSSWAGVEALREQLQVSAFASQIGGDGIFPFKLLNAAHNLPFMFAIAILNDALEQLAIEGQIDCKSSKLGPLLGKSKDTLPWCNFTLIEQGVGLRNDLAHRGRLLERGDCWIYIDAIKAELSAWKII